MCRLDPVIFTGWWEVMANACTSQADGPAVSSSQVKWKLRQGFPKTTNHVGWLHLCEASAVPMKAVTLGLVKAGCI